ncbi:vWA domain-containing protein [Eubacterium oxidoreducens]|uniref:VWA domain containing CoxE-like protein n=1 Tax=Eubacterium oxidoreducens TaxID=1732 RepID=A0A1G6BDE4_EUBOX|nr:vWA domain-containing protein [Eubacterium oxidoreducens]SDB18625.1 VWA domain containing CoxE-like protein [Eubacterium oxidoreducens]
MRENLTELVFILDKSGSMSGLESDTIGGFNSMVAKQQKEEGEALVSTILFDNAIYVIHDRVPIGDVKELTEDDYYVRGCTALLDAVGGAIHHIGNVHKYAREEDRPAKTLFVIITDGLENASRGYSFRDVKKMIEHEKEKYNWEFLFLGANIDAIEVAGSMGISKDRAANYNHDEEGTQLNYRVLDMAVSRARKCKHGEDMNAAFTGGEWKEDIDRDYKRRSSRNVNLR